MDREHEVKDISFRGAKMCLSVDGRKYEVGIATFSKKIADASTAQKQHYVISPSGYGIHWPELDEDLSIDGLIGIIHTCPIVKTTS